MPREKEGTENSGDIKAAPRAEFEERARAVLPALGSLLRTIRSLLLAPGSPGGQGFGPLAWFSETRREGGAPRMFVAGETLQRFCHLSSYYTQATRVFALNKTD